MALQIGSELSEEANQIDQGGKTTGFSQPQFAAPKIQDPRSFLNQRKKEEYIQIYIFLWGRITRSINIFNLLY